MYPLLKMAVPLPRITAFSRYLFIGPHPDDIEVACAPTVKRLTDVGKHVEFVILTDGRMGALDPALSGETLAARRRGEAAASAGLLGVSDVRFLPFQDGGMYAVEDAAAALAKEIVRVRPDVVFAPDPSVRGECHADHIKTGLAAKQAMCTAPFAPLMDSLGVHSCHAPAALALYYTDAPNARVNVTRQFPVRAQALACHKSQFSDADIANIVRYFMLRSLRLGALVTRCDGYRVYAPVHMHCFPEASRW